MSAAPQGLSRPGRRRSCNQKAAEDEKRGMWRKRRKQWPLPAPNWPESESRCRQRRKRRRCRPTSSRTRPILRCQKQSCDGKVKPPLPRVDPEHGGADSDQNRRRSHGCDKGLPLASSDHHNRDEYPKLRFECKHSQQGAADQRSSTQQPKPTISSAAIRKAFCPPTMLKDAAGLASAKHAISALGVDLSVAKQRVPASKAALTN
jgi:hypothetical protein